MRRAVSLDDQAMLEADEVDDITANRNLAAKFQAFESAVAQEFPEGPFVGHGLSAHRFCKAR